MNKYIKLLIPLLFFAVPILMGTSADVYYGLKNMMDIDGDFKYIQINGVRFDENNIGAGDVSYPIDLSDGISTTGTLPRTQGGLGSSTASTAEIQATVGATSNFQTQLNSKLTSATTTARINTEYDVDGNGKIDDVESIPNHWISNDDIQLQAANDKAIDFIVSGTGTVRVQYGSEAPRVLDNFTLYNFSTPGTVSANAVPQLVWVGTITGSADPHRRLEFRALLCLDVVGGNNTSYGFTIGNANQPISPNGTSSCGTAIRSINYNVCLQNLGSTTAQIIKSATAADSQQYTAPSSLMFTKFDLSVDQPVKFWMGVPTGGTQSVGVYNIEIKETAYVPTGTGAL